MRLGFFHPGLSDDFGGLGGILPGGGTRRGRRCVWWGACMACADEAEFADDI